MLTKSRSHVIMTHKVLECLCCITESEGREKTLKQSKGRGDSCFRDNLWGHQDPVEGPDKVSLGEDDLPLELVIKVMNMQDWVPVRLCDT